MNLTFKVIFILSINYFLISSSASSTNLIEATTQAYLNKDITTLETLHNQYSSNNTYELAYINYRLALLFMIDENQEDAEKLLDISSRILRDKINKPTSLDFSLLASVYSLKAGLGVFSGAVYGRKSSVSIDEAEKLDKNNPQIWLVRGLSAYHTPGIFGGSDKNALKYFNQSITLFLTIQNKNKYWGLEEALVWRALLHKKNNHIEASVKDLKLALRLNKDFKWAKELLTKFSQTKD